MVAVIATSGASCGDGETPPNCDRPGDCGGGDWEPPQVPIVDAGSESGADSGAGPVAVTDAGAEAEADAAVAADSGAGADAGAGPDAGAEADAGADADAGPLIRDQWIGGPCESAASCNYPGAICLASGFQGGHCSLACTRTCPDRASQPVTFCIDGDDATGRCVSKCATDADCRAGYRCGARGRFNEPTTLQNVCVPPDVRPAPLPASPSPYPARIAAVRATHDTTKLEQILVADGVSVPANSKVAVVRITQSAGAFSYQYFDFKGTLFSDAFWPASTIKLFAALAALETLEDRGHSVRSNIHYAGGYDGPFRTVMNDALIVSDNTSYDRLMLLAGFDEINTAFLAPERGFERTVLQRSYGAYNAIRNSPAITLDEGTKQTSIPARQGTGTYACANSGNCTNPFELGDAIRRVALHERLSDGERFRIFRDDLAYLRVALSTNKGQSIFSAAEAVFGAGNTVIYKKSGLAGGWRLDNAFLRDKATGEEYVVTIALPDTTPIPRFFDITKSSLSAIRAGRLTTTPVVP
ncbi:MAG: serine hydrolase [Deltaproteobacteria bacterium]|nr:serine hydrolase [Deltaproteobacteria bacterium]